MIDDIPVFGEQYVQPALDRVGESVTVAGIPTKALVDSPTEQLLQGIADSVEVSADSLLVRAKAGGFPDLRIGAELVVRGEGYRAYHVEESPDGATVAILCARES